MWILDFLAPRSCVFCGVPSRGSEKSICNGCFADLPWNEAPVSPVIDIFERSIAMQHYSFPVDVAIRRLKFNRKLFYAPALTEILHAAIALLPNDIDAVLPVPLHWRRKTVRGFNQAEELARPLAKSLQLPVVKGVVRSVATPFQSGLGAAHRASNLRRAFRVKKPLHFDHILLVDDVITTGATMRQLGRLLRDNGVARSSALAVARVRMG